MAVAAEQRGHAAQHERLRGTREAQEIRAAAGPARAREAARTKTNTWAGGGRRVERLLRVSVLRVRAHISVRGEATEMKMEK